MCDLLKMKKKNNIRNQSQRSRDHIKEKVASCPLKPSSTTALRASSFGFQTPKVELAALSSTRMTLSGACNYQEESLWRLQVVHGACKLFMMLQAVICVIILK